MSLNRKERRLKGIKKPEPIINIKVSDIEQIKQDAVTKGCKRAFLLLLAISVMVVRDKFPKFIRKQDREANFINEVLELYDTYDKGYVSLDELRACLTEETGINIEDYYK